MPKNNGEGNSTASFVPPPKRTPKVDDYRTQAARAETLGEWEEASRYYGLALEQSDVELALINSVQEGLSSNYEMQAIYDLVGDKLRDTFNAQVVMISQYDQTTQRIYHHYAIERGQHLHLPGWLPIDVSRANVVRLKKPVMINADEIIAFLEAEEMKVVPGTEIPKTWLGVPMLIGNEACGIVSLQNLDIENAFSPSDIALLTALTNSMSQSLENARLFHETQRLLGRMEAEMDLSRQAQKSILPLRTPERKGYDIGSLIVPARAVGGDFYDFIPLDDNHVCITIGDISDKGLPSALYMALTFSLIRSESARSINPKTILVNINNFLLKMDAKMFVTLLYCVLDFKSGRMQYSRAGHLAPIVVNPDGSFQELSMDLGQPLGLFGDIALDQQQFTIPSGGFTLLYSDGLLEALDESGNPFGEGRIKTIIAENLDKPADSICNILWEAVQQHSGDQIHQDDFTTVIIKRQ